MSCPSLHFCASRNLRQVEMGGGIFRLFTRMQDRLIVPLTQATCLWHYRQVKRSCRRGELHKYTMRSALQVNNLGCHFQTATFFRFATECRLSVYKDRHDSGCFRVNTPLAAVGHPDLTGGIENSLPRNPGGQFKLSGRKLQSYNASFSVAIASHLIFFRRPDPCGVSGLPVRANESPIGQETRLLGSQQLVEIVRFRTESLRKTRRG